MVLIILFASMMTGAAVMTAEEKIRRCEDFVTIHEREEPNVSPNVAPEIKERFLEHWKRIEFQTRDAKTMHEMYLIFARSQSVATRNRYVEMESFDRLKIIERYLPFLNNPDEVDDLVSELTIASHESLMSSHKLWYSREAFYIAQSFRQSAYRERLSEFVWQLLSPVSAPRSEVVKSFRQTFLMKFPLKKRTPLHDLMEQQFIEKLAGASRPDIPEQSGRLDETEMLAKVIERPMLISAIREVHDKYLEQGGDERRWSAMETSFWEKYNQFEKPARMERAGILHQVYQAFISLRSPQPEFL